jgi:C-terminal processing protease CtpA/Prc
MISMQPYRRIFILVFVFAMTILACRAQVNLPDTRATLSPTILVPEIVPTSLPARPVQPGEDNPEEPTSIIGNIPYTSPFFLNSTSEPFVLLEDETGFIQRDREYQFPLASQVIGSVTIHDDNTLTYDLTLPSIPQGNFSDVDNNGQSDTGVQVFVVAYWDNTWGDPFLEERDGTGWSTAYTSAIVDPNNNDEIIGGTLVVWAPDERQSFPTDFGEDGKLFTSDDPTAPIPAGYTFVNLDENPFNFYKVAREELDLNEGVVAVNDFSGLNYSEAFDQLFAKASREYPFTAEKGLNWQAIYDKVKPEIEDARNSEDFYRVLRDFAFSIPDGHVGLQLDPQVFFEENGGGLGLVLAELSDGKIIVTDVLPDLPAAKAGIKPGAEIVAWNGEPVKDTIEKIVPALGPYSTNHARRQAQVVFLTRVPPESRVEVSYKNPGEQLAEQTALKAVVDYDSLFQALGYNESPLLPIEGEVLQPSGLGYLRINTFDDNYHLMAQLWERYIQEFLDQEVPGIIIDIRSNPGGNSGLANDFAGFFFEDEMDLYRRSYFNEVTGQFEYEEPDVSLKPAPSTIYEQPLAVLVGPNCASACEGFAYALQQDNRAIVVGNFPSAGMFGEVGRGQYNLPEGLSMQMPTGRPETMDGEVLIEGAGVIPDITVPVTEQSALGQVDNVLQAAIEALLKEIR